MHSSLCFGDMYIQDGVGSKCKRENERYPVTRCPYWKPISASRVGFLEGLAWCPPQTDLLDVLQALQEQLGVTLIELDLVLCCRASLKPDGRRRMQRPRLQSRGCALKCWRGARHGASIRVRPRAPVLKTPRQESGPATT